MNFSQQSNTRYAGWLSRIVITSWAEIQIGDDFDRVSRDSGYPIKHVRSGFGFRIVTGFCRSIGAARLKS